MDNVHVGEHDGKCEKVGTARAIAPRVNLSSDEFRAVIEGDFGYLPCRCDMRRESKFSWVTVEKRELRRRTIEAVMLRRRGLRVVRRIKAMHGAVKSLGEGKSPIGGEVIEVDFRMRRRVR